ncbi:MAG TPA: helix-turn-helix domain-containing protein [Candidatus Mediterraneibacter caccogallinarum]|nr:helix-turn-helix domain-containing protein [Candidatus Mediterraneibacter caccogallinarum]
MLNERLREARKQKNYSQEYVAEKVHTSRQTVLRWENGTSEPGVETVKKLAELYDVSVNYLLEISENQAAPAPVESPDKSVHPAEKEKEEYQYEIFFFLILSILSVAVAPVGLLISIVSIIWARKKRIPKLFYLVVTICLLINIWNCIMIFQMFFLDIGYATISS